MHEGERAASDSRARTVDRLLGLATAAAALVWILRLAIESAGIVFGADECFHATMAGWIHTHGTLPATLPGLYGGFDYYYQPLLHLFGALTLALPGGGVLRFLPLAAAAATLAVLGFGARRTVPLHARLWAVLVLVASTLFATYAVRLYAESLSALLVTAGALALVHQQHAGGRAATIGLGALAGLAILAKFAGWSLAVLIGVAALVRLVRGEREQARHLGAALALALLVAAPWLVRNQILFGSALYPLGAPDLDRGLYALERARFSFPPAAFFAGLPQVLGPFMLAMNAMAALSVGIERRFGWGHALWAFALGGIAVTGFMPMAAARHLVAFLPLLALGASWVVADALARRGLLMRPVGAVLIAAAAVTLVRFPEHRKGASPPPPLMDAFAAIARVTPGRANILSLWTYDTYYHGHRAATWPLAWGQTRSPAGLFRTRDPQHFAATMDSLGIGYVLVPKAAPLEPWNGANYPESFIVCARALVENGGLRITWQNERFVLLGRGP